MKLGILDWGIGGLGTLKLIDNYAQKDIVYLSDSGFIPYGKVEKNALKFRVTQCIQFLQSKGVNYVFVACNSAGTVTPETKQTGSIIPFGKELINILEEEVLILGGNRTVKSQVFGNKKNYFYQSGQALSALIEAGKKEEAMQLLNPILYSFKGKYLLHACTHYPAMASLIEDAYPQFIQLDPAKTGAEKLSAIKIATGKNEFYTTGNPKASIQSAQLAFNFTIPNISQIEIP